MELLGPTGFSPPDLLSLNAGDALAGGGVLDNGAHFQVHDLLIRDCAVDGVHLGSNADRHPADRRDSPLSDIRFERVTMTHSGRHGLAIVGPVKDVRLRDCRFTDNISMGCDIEPTTGRLVYIDRAGERVPASSSGAKYLVYVAENERLENITSTSLSNTAFRAIPTACFPPAAASSTPIRSARFRRRRRCFRGRAPRSDARPAMADTPDYQATFVEP